MASLSRWIDDVLTASGRFGRKIPIYRGMLTGHWGARMIAYALPLLLVGALFWMAWDGYQRIVFGHQRIAQVDIGLKNPPTRDSQYCRRLFGFGVEYPPCYAAERAGYIQFQRAWTLGRDLGTLREQLIGCYLEGRRTEGMSWAAASHCAEADTPGAETVQ